MIREKELYRTFYEIQVKGYLDGLHGLVTRVRDYGLVLISINSATDRHG